MERVAFLVEETGERISCLLNPESVVVRRLAGIRPRRILGTAVTGSGLADDVLLHTGGGMTEMFLNLLFDVSLGDLPTEAADVRNLTLPLWRLSENADGGQNSARPAKVRFIWGKSWNIPGVVASVSENLDYFDQLGVPLRSWLRMRFLRVVEPVAETSAVQSNPSPEFDERSLLEETALPASTSQSTTAEVNIHQYTAGERIDQLVRKYYGGNAESSLWRTVAAYNRIDDPLDIEAGTILQFPPLDVLERKNEPAT